MRRETGSALVVLLGGIVALLVIFSVASLRVTSERARAQADERRIAALWLARSAVGVTGASSGIYDLEGTRATLTVSREGSRTTAHVSLKGGSVAKVSGVHTDGGAWSSWEERWEP